MTTSKPPRVQGLDSIRVLCALIVFLGHGAAPTLINPFSETSIWFKILRLLYNNLWNGSAAVAIFFVISGFCIHYPFVDQASKLSLRTFYIRRYVRLLLPVAAAIPLGQLITVNLSLFRDSILWTILAELIYYTIYPLIRQLRFRLGSWKILLIVAFIASLAVALSSPLNRGYGTYGAGLNWILGLPCWLLGCMLAERIKLGVAQDIKFSQILSWRILILGTAWITSVVRFHGPFGYPWSMSFFAILAAAWLGKEIRYYQKVTPNEWIEAGGAWSYSLYLMHLAAGALWNQFQISLSPPLDWLAKFGFVLAFCYMFYLLVEKPSHYLARKLSRAC
jgi:peptidoglycan/LPS O-acetylase OafA/YrhL